VNGIPGNIPHEPTSWFWNIRVGDKIQIGSSERIYTVVGPMEIGPGPNLTLGNNGGNSEQFVNATLYPTRGVGPNAVTLTWDYLYLVNGRDDDGNGIVDDGWDNLSSSYETEQWQGALGASQNDLKYNITRRPASVTRGRETFLPTDVLVDLSTWNTTVFPSGSERSRLPVNPYSGSVDILVNPDGTVVPTTIYSSPASFSMGAAFFHFWLAERGDLAAPDLTQGVAPYLPLPQGMAPRASPVRKSRENTA